MSGRITKELWRLSNHYLRERFDRVEVWADCEGEAALRAAGCEYDAWHRLPPVPDGLERLWNIGKLQAAAAQTEAFLHVDGDVFWRQPAPCDVPFLVQSIERRLDTHVVGWWDDFGAAPVARPDTPTCHNFGVFGGTAVREIAAACREVLEFLGAHRAIVSGAGNCCRGLPMLVEQVWVPEILRVRHGVDPTFLLREEHLQEDARRVGYYHAMGLKDKPHAMAAVRARHKEVFGQL